MPEVAKERKFIIDAKIIQIMKTKKEYKHNNLVQETILMITMFKAQPADVKQRIEDLLQRQYLERKAEDRATYVYLPWTRIKSRMFLGIEEIFINTIYFSSRKNKRRRRKVSGVRGTCLSICCIYLNAEMKIKQK